ncbi:hypothetical protein CVT24_000480 [Panaeolus cyanescens]|uniref:Methyltransferase small domain-containing protein n=1 Tax=Panaeolus cyanescens TaxID=181874 RepID=A0A409V8D0_9AGAR|nr:hypothetical protein CVT24_000480 [Panaeolus cyanescens]
MIPTPDLSHLKKQDYDQIYEPAEDTFLLLDALEEDGENLKASNPSICLEVGSGSGCVTSFISKIIGTAVHTAIVQRLSGKVDVILFNPPYVPTSEEEVIEAQKYGNIGGAWAGGADGMQVTDVFLGRVERLLSPSGRFYLVALKENNIPKICKDMADKYGLESKIVLQRRAGREHLFIICFTRMGLQD